MINHITETLFQVTEPTYRRNYGRIFEVGFYVVSKEGIKGPYPTREAAEKQTP